MSQNRTPRLTTARHYLALLVAAVVAATATVLSVPSDASAASAAIHINAGTFQSHNLNGTRWLSDRGYTGGGTKTRPGTKGTSVPQVYGSARYGMSAYRVKVPSGKYRVTLRFAETQFAANGRRVFDVRAEGKLVVDNLDVHRAAKGRYKALGRVFTTSVTDGRLDLTFSASRDRAMLSSFSVEPLVTAVAKSSSTTTVRAPAAGYPFSSSSVWRSRVEKAPLHSRSAAMSKHLASSVTSRYNGVAAFNVWDYNSSYYVVDGTKTSRTTVKFDNCQKKSSVPAGLYDGARHFVDVPIPAGAVPAAGSDAALVVYSPTTDQLWELWRASKRSDGWYACWGGRMDKVSQNIGHFSGPFGTTATGLPHAAGQISLADVRSGSIEHAVGLVLAEPKSHQTYSWPAQRSDGFSTHPDAVPEGMRLRLDPTVDVKSLRLHPVAEMVALAAQRYGFIVVDKGGATAVYTESGTPEKLRTGKDPWVGVLGGTPAYNVMKGFPWHEVEVLPMDYGKPR